MSSSETPIEAPIVTPIVEEPRFPDDRQEYRFVIKHDNNFFNFHVQFEYVRDNEDLFYIDEDDDFVFISFDFRVFDWFKAFTKRMGINQVPDDELVKHIAVTYWKDI